ncbi:hypothetical protein B0J14DRAFT_541611 [Halenospora varia]|nr:hypothetical protein B0J14DRAFT_541611 [Halenospora varia]
MAEAAPKEFPGLSLHVTITIAPENEEKFLAAFRTVWELVAAEPECIFFEIYKSATELGVFSWVEGWTKDQKWLMEVQLQKEYYKPYFAITEPMFIKPREFKIYEKLPGWAKAKPEHFER